MTTKPTKAQTAIVRRAVGGDVIGVGYFGDVPRWGSDGSAIRWDVLDRCKDAGYFAIRPSKKRGVSFFYVATDKARKEFGHDQADLHE